MRDRPLMSAMSASPHIIAIHGIRTRLTDPAWPWRFSGHCQRRGIAAHIETEHYKAGPYPRVNQLFVNPRVAKALATRIMLRREILGPAPIHIIAHSNGCPVAVNLAKRLAKSEIGVSTLILIGAAIHSDVKKSGLLELGRSGYIDKAVAYWSPDDGIIRPLQSLPGAYGSLGARGFEFGRDRFGYQANGYEPVPAFPFYISRQFPGFGHSEYFSARWETATYDTALIDMGFDLTPPQ